MIEIKMTINPSEMPKLLKDQIKISVLKFQKLAKFICWNGIARVYGLDNVQAGEMVDLKMDQKMALNLKR